MNHIYVYIDYAYIFMHMTQVSEILMLYYGIMDDCHIKHNTLYILIKINV